MKKTTIISLSALFLTACSSSNYDTVVGTESYTEVYQTETVQPVAPPLNFGQDTDLAQEANASQETGTNNQTATEASAQTASTPEETTEIIGVCDDQRTVLASSSDMAEMPNFNNYLIQVISVQEQNKVIGIEEYAKKLSSNYSQWKNKKTVNGEPWSTLLIGEFTSVEEARTTLASLSGELSEFSPFVVSVKNIQCSGSQSLTKLK